MSGQPQSPNRRVPLPHQTADDEPPPAMVTVGDPTALDHDAALYEGFTQSPPPDDVLLDASGAPFILDRSILVGVLTSDSYARVRDNQAVFRDLALSLSRIRNEFAKDHNRGIYADLAGVLELNAEAGATLSQIEDGVVRKSQLTDGLKPALTALLVIASAYGGLKELLEDAVALLDLLLKALGIS